MKIALLVTLLVAALLAIVPSAEGQVAAVPASKGGPSILELSQADRVKAKTDEEKEALSIRERIEADRARAKTDEENASKDRPWDRDANGKRPWER